MAADRPTAVHRHRPPPGAPPLPTAAGRHPARHRGPPLPARHPPHHHRPPPRPPTRQQTEHPRRLRHGRGPASPPPWPPLAPPPFSLHCVPPGRPPPTTSRSRGALLLHLAPPGGPPPPLRAAGPAFLRRSLPSSPRVGLPGCPICSMAAGRRGLYHTCFSTTTSTRRPRGRCRCWHAMALGRRPYSSNELVLLWILVNCFVCRNELVIDWL